MSSIAVGVILAGVTTFGGNGDQSGSDRAALFNGQVRAAETTIAATPSAGPVQQRPEPTSRTGPATAPKKKARPTADRDRKRVPVGARESGEDKTEPEHRVTKRPPSNRKPSATSRPRKSKAPALTIGGPAVIRNLVSGLCLDLPDYGTAGTGTKVTQFTCRPGDQDNQMFELVGQDATFAVRNLKSQNCLDFAGTGSVAPGTDVAVGPCVVGADENMMFRKQQQGSGFYLRHVKSGLCLDVSNADNGNMRRDQQITLFTCSPADDHVWEFS